MAQIIRECTGIVRKHGRIVILTTGLFVTLSLLVALLKPTLWSARQGLIVRDEVARELGQLGRFESTDAMQTAQETILEMARYKSVVEQALQEVGPPKGRCWKRWPKAKDIESCQENISIEAPQGAQFGRTEMIYLVVKDETPERAIALNESVCRHMDEQLKHVRRSRYQSVINELVKAVSVATEDLNAATRRVQTLEQKVGPDLPELRNMVDMSGGDGPLARGLGEIKNELRQARAQREAQKNLREYLQQAANDPAQLLATPNQLLELQPSLRRLKEGLVDAQLRTAQLAGSRSKDHPEVIAALQAEERVRRELFAEVSVAIRGLESDVAISDRRMELLAKQQADVESRLNRLASIRASYANLTSEVRNKAEILERIRADLSAARGNERAASEVSLVARVDRPVVDSRPEGPSRKSIVLAGLVFGLCSSAGIIFLLEPRSGTPRHGATPLPLGGWSWPLRWPHPGAMLGGRRATDPQPAPAIPLVDDRRNQSQPGRRQVDFQVRGVMPADAATENGEPGADNTGTTGAGAQGAPPIVMPSTPVQDGTPSGA